MSTKQDIWILGGICCIVGLYAIAYGITHFNVQDVLGGFFLLGLGVVFMASSSEERREEVYRYFFRKYKKQSEILTNKSQEKKRDKENK